MAEKQEKAMIFVDSANFYHSLKEIHRSVYDIDFLKLAELLLVADRKLVKIRYYAAPVDRTAMPKEHRAQQRFWADLKKQGIEVDLGYLQKRIFACTKCGYERIGITCDECGHLFGEVGEKGVDVNIASDIVYHAALDSYDIGYLISSDGDLAGACKRARLLGKRMIYVCIPPIESMALKSWCNYTAEKDGTFFDQCARASRYSN